MANWFCSVFNVVCVVNVCPCRSELIDSAWVGQKCIKKNNKKTDTDSLMFEVCYEENIDVMHSEEFSFSNYPVDTSVFQRLITKYRENLRMKLPAHQSQNLWDCIQQLGRVMYNVLIEKLNVLRRRLPKGLRVR